MPDNDPVTAVPPIRPNPALIEPTTDGYRWLHPILIGLVTALLVLTVVALIIDAPWNVAC